MGEMADFILDQYVDDYYGEWENYEPEQPLAVRCKYCGRGGLHWEPVGNGWRLFTAKGKMHSCKQYKK